MKASAGPQTSGYVTSTGSVYMWGYNSASGQIGNNTTTSATVPTNISTFGSLNGRAVTQLAVGNYSSIALDSTGTLHAWGDNWGGSYGNNTMNSNSMIPIMISPMGSIIGRTITSISCGGGNTFAIDTTGTLHAWGANGNGQLGNNSVTNSPLPINISTFGSLIGQSVAKISGGSTHTICLDTTGNIHTWGNSGQGQLGNNTTSFSRIPINISTFGSLIGLTMSQIAVGSMHNLAIDSTGNVHSWGYNVNGQVGNNSTTNVLVPIVLSNFGSLIGRTTIHISCGDAHSVAIDTTGYLHSWGNNNFGQLGNNTLVNSSIPINISTFGSLVGRSITSSTCGLQYTLALDTTGAIHAWGHNDTYSLGTGNLTDYKIPVLINLSLITNSSLSTTLYMNFTGQHRCFVDGFNKNIKDIEGLIVCANTGEYVTTSENLGGDFAFTKGLSAITTNDSLPVVSLSSKPNDKSVFGVVSLKTNFSPVIDPTDTEMQQALMRGDVRAEINSSGEGAMWVCDAAGPLAAGDYVTSSKIPGYGMLQADDILHNFTVAKTTTACDFDVTQTQPRLILRTDPFGNNVLDSQGAPIFDPVLDENSYPVLDPKFKTRLITETGSQLTPEEATSMKAAGSNVYTAAFVGVTYHCG
jgi:alpha-tubulin suppressor-like RCC1 family protein